MIAISHSASFHPDFQGITHTSLASLLGANYIVEGSARTSGSLIRVTVALVDASTAQQRWAARYDKEIGDTLNVQDEIARKAVIDIQTSLGIPVSERKPTMDRSYLSALTRTDTT